MPNLSSRPRLPDHRGRATWGERIVPLEEFKRAAALAGSECDATWRAAAERALHAPVADGVPVEGPYRRIVLCGGVYSNHLALAALLDEARRLAADAVYCLGDLGGFGPRPEAVWPLVARGGVRVVQGNYEQALAEDAPDCRCGYTDPRDNRFAELSYRYTAAHCSPAFRAFLGALPARRRVRVGAREILLVHGSPRRVNEFLFESTSPVAFLETLCDRAAADAIACTHTGLHWHAALPSGRDVINVGALGRPANDGTPRIWFALIEERDRALAVELRPLGYDHHALAVEMRAEGLPEEFVATILSGWWTTCLEILPARERARSRY